MASWSSDPVPARPAPWEQLGIPRAEWVELDRLSEQLEQTPTPPVVTFALADQVESDRYGLATLEARTFDRPDQVPPDEPGVIAAPCERPGCGGTFAVAVPTRRGRPRRYCGTDRCNALGEAEREREAARTLDLEARAARRREARRTYLDLLDAVHALARTRGGDELADDDGDQA